MAADPVTLQNGITIAGVLVIAGFLAMLETRIEKVVDSILNRPERIKREKDLIANETSHLADKERAEETRRWVRDIRDNCRHCKPLTSTDAIRRDA